MAAWSEEEDALVRRCFAEGASAAAAAARLAGEGFAGRSRMAVVGRWHRLDLRRANPNFRAAQAAAAKRSAEKSVAGRKAPSPRPSPQPGEGVRPGRQARQFNPVFGRGTSVPKPPRPVAPGDAPAGAPADASLLRPAVRFLDRTERQCGYPVLFGVPIAEKLVCGAPKALDVPYCPGCMGIAYQPAPRPREVAA